MARAISGKFDCCLPWQGIREQVRRMRATVFMVSINDYICSHEWEQDRKGATCDGGDSFFENRSIFNLLRAFQFMLVIDTITCKYAVISYSCIISA